VTLIGIVDLNDMTVGARIEQLEHILAGLEVGVSDLDRLVDCKSGLLISLIGLCLERDQTDCEGHAAQSDKRFPRPSYDF